MGDHAVGRKHETAREAALALLASRTGESTVCPSEVARVLAASDATAGNTWRDKMPEVHAAIDGLLSDGLIRLSWKGRALSERSGPYRIRNVGRG